MYSHSDYYHAPHPSAPRRLSHPNDLNAFADQLEAQAARARAAASFTRIDSFPDRYEWQYSNSPTFRNYRDDAHGRPIPCEYHPGPEYRHSRGYDFYDGPRYIPSAQGCPRPSRYPQPYFEENYDDYPERPSCPGPACSRPCRSHISRPPQPYFEDHGEFYERPPYWGSIGSRQCGSPPQCGCSGEPEQCSDVSWVEFDPSTFAAALVPRLDPGQGPRGLARSHGPKCADRSQPGSHEDVPSAVSGLLGLPEKKSCEAVSRPVQRQHCARPQVGPVLQEKDLQVPSARAAVDLNDLSSVIQSFFVALNGGSQEAATQAEHPPTSQPTMTVPSWASVHPDVPKIPKQAEGPVGCTYAVPATAQLHNSAPSPESEEHRRSDASVEARHIMEAIKRSLDPKHNARPIHPTVHFAQKGSIATQNGASVSAPTPVVSIVPTPARPVTTASELARARPSARSPSPSLPKPPMEAIEAIEQEFVDLEYKFQFPTTVDFLSSTAPTRSLAYTANNMPLRIFEHALTSLLTRLDAIESAGSTEVRDARKDLVQRIEGVLNELESKKLGVWQQQNKDEDASAKVYEPHSEDDPADEVKQEAEKESKDDTPTDDISSSPEAVDAEVGEVSVVPVLAPLTVELYAPSDVPTPIDVEKLTSEDAVVGGEFPPKADDVEDPELPSYPRVPSYPPFSNIEDAVSSLTSSPVHLTSDLDSSDDGTAERVR